MTTYDLLKDNLATLRRFHKNGIATDAIRFIPLYEDWLRMQSQGLKKGYCEAVLGDKYGYTPRYIRMVVKFMADKVI